MPWIQSQTNQIDGLLARSLLSPQLSSSLSSPPPSSSGTKINPAVLFVIIILAILFFISGLLHLLVRFLSKQRSSSTISQSNRYPEMSTSGAFQRQLQHLFNLHDSGLDQAFIDALPLFHYREIMGLKEPFDCAVCLCEFSEQDKLRLLPLCGHAFHIDCIDTWLLSNSTCPLCRGTLFTPGFSFENPVFDLDDSRDLEDGFGDGVVREKRVFSIRLGKFRSTNDGGDGDGGGGGDGGRERVEREEGETSSCNLDARRCYSMGSFQYVVASSDLQVALCPNRGGIGKGRGRQNGDLSGDGDLEGKKISIGVKGESFSVSKIWQWSKKGRLHTDSDTHMVSWTHRTQAT